MQDNEKEIAISLAFGLLLYILTIGANMLTMGQFGWTPADVAIRSLMPALPFTLLLVGMMSIGTRHSDTPYTGPREYQPPPPPEPQPAQPEPSRPALPPPAATALAPYSTGLRYWDDDEDDAPPAPRVVAVLRPGQRALPPPPDVEPLVRHRRPEPEPVRAKRGKEERGGKGKR